MQEADWEALQTGDRARSDIILREMLRGQVADLARALSSNTLNTLAWMVADGVLDFRFAIPRLPGSSGDYHDKVGVFIDDAGDRVAIHGSYNDSEKGSLNGEAFSVFRSWENGQAPYVERHHRRLTELWNRGNSQFQVLPLPEAIRQEIVRLRSGKRPWRGGDGTIAEPAIPCQQDAPVSGVVLRPYQLDAVRAWKSQGYRGIFEMATGTGKTFTALAAAEDRRGELGQVALVILVPYLHLLEQWRQACEGFGFLAILCSSDHPQWPTDVRSKIQDFRYGGLSSLCILAVHQTAATQRFAEATQGLRPANTVLIADEVHRLGAPHLRDALLPHADMRLGLSATPSRWHDESGTRDLLCYFAGVCFDYSLDQAIGTSLTRYRYLPVLTHLTDEEGREYEELSGRIAALASSVDRQDVDSEELLKRLLLRRAHVVAAAENKLPLLLSLLRRQVSECEQEAAELKHVLV